MSTSPNHDSLASRSLSVLRNMGALVAINPDQTYVATSIPGLGTCKSTYCQPERRELRKAPANTGALAPLLAVAMVALSLLAGCAGYPLVAARDVSDRGQNERGLADCQIYAEPVSPGASSGRDDLSGGLAGAGAGGDWSLGTDSDRSGTVGTAVPGRHDARMPVAGACLIGSDLLVMN